MAISESISTALNAVCDELVRAQNIGEALEAAAGAAVPSWVYVYVNGLEALRSRCEALEAVLRVQVLPALAEVGL